MFSSSRNRTKLIIQKAINTKCKEEECSEESDSYADPLWQPDNIEDDLVSESACSSPVTEEQVNTADIPEQNLIDFPFEDLESRIPKQISDHGGSSPIDDVKKLISLKLKVKEWKEKRRLAFVEKKNSAARRLSKNIKKYESLIENISCPKLSEHYEERDQSNDGLQDNRTRPTDCLESVGEKKKTGGRKKNFCLYCDKLITNYCRHIEKMHPNSEGLALANIQANKIPYNVPIALDCINRTGSTCTQKNAK